MGKACWAWRGNYTWNSTINRNRAYNPNKVKFKIGRLFDLRTFL